MNEPASPPEIFEPLQRLGAALIAEGSLDPAGLDRAERAAAQTGERLDRVLGKLGLVPEQTLVTVLARTLCVGVAVPGDLPAEPVMPDAISARFIRNRRILPLAADPHCASSRSASLPFEW